jgi:hypothetical protein
MQAYEIGDREKFIESDTAGPTKGNRLRAYVRVGDENTASENR